MTIPQGPDSSALHDPEVKVAQCCNCRFHRPPNEDARPPEESGSCHRYAPRPISVWNMSEQVEVRWPSVDDTEWCGEHEWR